MQTGNIIELLLELISLPSYRGYEKGDSQIALYIAELMKRHGVKVELQDLGNNQFNAIGRVGAGGKTVLLVGHLDTVGIENMSVPPFGALVKDRIYGRGAADMKAGIAAMITTLVKLAKEPNLRGTVTFLGDACEEEGNLGAIEFLRSNASEYDYVIVGEPTNLRLVTAHKGVMWLEVVFKGSSAHAAAPERGTNAIVAAAEFVKLIESQLKPLLSERKHPLLGPPTINVGTIQGGEAPNVVPSICRVQIDRRFLPEEQTIDILKEVVCLATVAAKIAATEVEVTEMSQTKGVCHAPFQISEDAELVKTARAILKKLGLPDQPSSVPFWTEAAIFAKEGNVPTIVLGPGDPLLAHSPNEYVEKDQLFKAVEIYYNLCKKLFQNKNIVIN